MKNHVKTDGQLLQANKKWSDLKESQKQKIMTWLREETVAYYKIHKQYPMGRYSEDVVDNVYDKIRAAGIWIPYEEVYRHYTSKKLHMINSLDKNPMWKRVYLDMTNPANACTAVISKDVEIVRAGTTIYSMPVSDKNEEYDRIALDKDVHFIFDDCIPELSFYTIPYIDIFAFDSKGGLLGTVGERTDIESGKKIIYVDADRRCYVAGQNLKHFMEKGKHWRDSMKRWDRIQFFTSVADAKKRYSFYEGNSSGENTNSQEK